MSSEQEKIRIISYMTAENKFISEKGESYCDSGLSYQSKLKWILFEIQNGNYEEIIKSKLEAIRKILDKKQQYSVDEGTAEDILLAMEAHVSNSAMSIETLDSMDNYTIADTVIQTDTTYQQAMMESVKNNVKNRLNKREVLHDMYRSNIDDWQDSIDSSKEVKYCFDLIIKGKISEIDARNFLQANHESIEEKNLQMKLFDMIIDNNTSEELKDAALYALASGENDFDMLNHYSAESHAKYKGAYTLIKLFNEYKSNELLKISNKRTLALFQMHGFGKIINNDGDSINEDKVYSMIVDLLPEKDKSKNNVYTSEDAERLTKKFREKYIKQIRHKFLLANPGAIEDYRNAVTYEEKYDAFREVLKAQKANEYTEKFYECIESKDDDKAKEYIDKLFKSKNISRIPTILIRICFHERTELIKYVVDNYKDTILGYFDDYQDNFFAKNAYNYLKVAELYMIILDGSTQEARNFGFEELVDENGLDRNKAVKKMAEYSPPFVNNMLKRRSELRREAEKSEIEIPKLDSTEINDAVR